MLAGSDWSQTPVEQVSRTHRTGELNCYFFYTSIYLILNNHEWISATIVDRKDFILQIQVEASGNPLCASIGRGKPHRIKMKRK